MTAAIERLRGKKDEGEDGIPAEFIKALEGHARKEFISLCMQICKDVI